MSDKYECRKCHYIYDPKVGDPKNNIPAGTPFSNLPSDWCCPTCGTFLRAPIGDICCGGEISSCETFKKKE